MALHNTGDNAGVLSLGSCRDWSARGRRRVLLRLVRLGNDYDMHGPEGARMVEGEHLFRFGDDV